jgi:hypothetical protein
LGREKSIKSFPITGKFARKRDSFSIKQKSKLPFISYDVAMTLMQNFFSPHFILKGEEK